MMTITPNYLEQSNYICSSWMILRYKKIPKCNLIIRAVF